MSIWPHHYIHHGYSCVAEWLSPWIAEQEDRGSIPGLATWIFRDWLSPASKTRYGWKIAKSTLILKSTNQPTKLLRQIDIDISNLIYIHEFSVLVVLTSRVLRCLSNISIGSSRCPILSLKSQWRDTGSNHGPIAP